MFTLNCETIVHGPNNQSCRMNVMLNNWPSVVKTCVHLNMTRSVSLLSMINLYFDGPDPDYVSA